MKRLLIFFVVFISTTVHAQVGVETYSAHTNQNNKKEKDMDGTPSQGAKQPALPEKNTDTPNKYAVSTLAGQNIAGNTDGQGAAALLSTPASVSVDAKGNLYVADATNNKIRKITPDGMVTTLTGRQTPGKKDGPLSEATFYYPAGVAIDTKGNLYIADKGNHVIRKISTDGMVSTLAGNGQRSSIDGPAFKASFDKPVAVAVDTAGNVYVSDAANHKIRKITPAGLVSTLAGSGELGSLDGKGAAASFYNPSGIAVDAAGNVYVADHDNNRIRKITPDGTVTTIAGSDAAGNLDGSGTEASFFNPSDVAVDAVGNVYITDQVNHKVRKLSPGGEVTTLAGSGVAGSADGTGGIASFNYPSGIAVDAAGNIYVADQLNCKIRKIVLIKKQ